MVQLFGQDRNARASLFSDPAATAFTVRKRSKIHVVSTGEIMRLDPPFVMVCPALVFTKVNFWYRLKFNANYAKYYYN